MAPRRRDLTGLGDDLISRARYGEITPEEAEAEAKANGLEPFEQKPELPAFDPMQETRWTIAMAVAWIAWRDLELVRESSPGIGSDWWLWFFREWNEPINGGKSFARRSGWFLESQREATTVWLSLSETVMRTRDELPASWQMRVSDAEKVLWRSLSQGELTAEALNEDGRPTDIPAREWSYLKLFEDGKRDVLKYEPLDRSEPYTKVKLRRDDLLRLWPKAREVVEQQEATWQIEPEMIQPLLDPGSSGFVPLCAALHWIMTKGGTQPVTINDLAAWQSSTDQLRALVAGGEIEMNGLRRGHALTERLPAEALAIIRILPPLYNTLDQITVGAPSHIACTAYVDADHWRKDFNDELYERGKAGPTWTHLQVRKSEILKRWPRPAPKAKGQTECLRWLQGLMAASPDKRSRSREALRADAMKRFAPLSARQFDRAWILATGNDPKHPWSKAGRPSRKSNHRTK